MNKKTGYIAMDGELFEERYLDIRQLNYNKDGKLTAIAYPHGKPRRITFSDDVLISYGVSQEDEVIINDNGMYTCHPITTFDITFHVRQGKNGTIFTIDEEEIKEEPETETETKTEKEKRK